MFVELRLFCTKLSHASGDTRKRKLHLSPDIFKESLISIIFLFNVIRVPTGPDILAKSLLLKMDKSGPGKVLTFHNFTKVLAMSLLLFTTQSKLIKSY